MFPCGVTPTITWQRKPQAVADQVHYVVINSSIINQLNLLAMLVLAGNCIEQHDY